MAVNYGKCQMSIKVTCYASKHYTSLQYLVAPGHAYMCSMHCNICSAAEKQFLQNALPNATNDSKQMSTKITTGLSGWQCITLHNEPLLLFSWPWTDYQHHLDINDTRCILCTVHLVWQNNHHIPEEQRSSTVQSLEPQATCTKW